MLELHEINKDHTGYQATLPVADTRGIKRKLAELAFAVTREGTKGEPVFVDPSKIITVQTHSYRPYRHQCVAVTGGVKLDANVTGEDLRGARIIFHRQGRNSQVLAVWETQEEVMAMLGQ